MIVSSPLPIFPDSTALVCRSVVENARVTHCTLARLIKQQTIWMEKMDKMSNHEIYKITKWEIIACEIARFFSDFFFAAAAFVVVVIGGGYISVFVQCFRSLIILACVI